MAYYSKIDFTVRTSSGEIEYKRTARCENSEQLKSAIENSEKNILLEDDPAGQFSTWNRKINDIEDWNLFVNSARVAAAIASIKTGGALFPALMPITDVIKEMRDSRLKSAMSLPHAELFTIIKGAYQSHSLEGGNLMFYR